MLPLVFYLEEPYHDFHHLIKRHIWTWRVQEHNIHLLLSLIEPQRSKTEPDTLVRALSTMGFGTHAIDLRVNCCPGRCTRKFERFVREAGVLSRVSAGGIEVDVTVGVEEIAPFLDRGNVRAVGCAELAGAWDYLWADG